MKDVFLGVWLYCLRLLNVTEIFEGVFFYFFDILNQGGGIDILFVSPACDMKMFASTAACASCYTNYFTGFYLCTSFYPNAG